NDSPAANQWKGWVRSFAHFGRLVGNRLALRNSLLMRTPENRTRYFKCADFDFYDFWEAGRLRGIKIANLAYDFFERADFSTDSRARFVEDVAFDGTLAEPLGLYGPQLPKINPSTSRREQAAA